MSESNPEGESSRCVDATYLALVHNELLQAIQNDQRILSEIKALERVTVHREGEVWELEVEDAAQGDDAWEVYLIGRARRIS